MARAHQPNKKKHTALSPVAVAVPFRALIYALGTLGASVRACVCVKHIMRYCACIECVCIYALRPHMRPHMSGNHRARNHAKGPTVGHTSAPVCAKHWRGTGVSTLRISYTHLTETIVVGAKHSPGPQTHLRGSRMPRLTSRNNYVRSAQSLARTHADGCALWSARAIGNNRQPSTSISSAPLLTPPPPTPPLPSTGEAMLMANASAALRAMRV